MLAREGPVRNDGPHYPLPYDGPGSWGLGKPLKPITHPLRADLPIWLGAEGPRNVALAGEIADGWLAVYFSPRVAEQYRDWLEDGHGRRGARHGRETFEVAANCQVVVTDDRESALARFKPSLALYLGGMGAPSKNFHADVFARMGYGEAVDEIKHRFLAGDREGAVAAVPDELVAETAIVGTESEVREQVLEWERAGVTTLLTGCRDVEQVRAVAKAAHGLAPGDNTF